jgi:tetratricopeptide (TPR) repeat protein
VEDAVRNALVIVTCLIVAACSATDLSPRPLERGFLAAGGVVDPYEDGRRNLAAGRYEVAIERFGQVLANDRTSLDALNGLAIAYAGLGRFEIAQSYFERALQVDATNAVTLNNYGWSLIEQGRLRDAKPFLELALHHAAEADVPVVAMNIESIGRARPSALIATLEKGSPPGADTGHRLIRVASNVYRLEAAAGPVGPHGPATVADDAISPAMALRQHPAAGVSPDLAQPRPDAPADSVVPAQGIGAAGSAQASAEQVQAAEADLDMPVAPQFGDALQPEPVPESEAPVVLPGEKT